MKRRALLPFLGLLLAACDPAPAACDVESAEGLYRVVAIPDPSPIPFAELFALDVTADGATALTFDATMPAHGHGMQTQPTVESQGDGAFRVEGLKFHMPGSWTLTFELDGPAGADTATCKVAHY